MQTRLSKLLGGLIESIWLAVVIIIPLFFNVFSSRIFEPDKVAILRTLCLILLAAWIVKIIDEGGFKWGIIKKEDGFIKSIIKIPLFIPVLALSIVFGIATILSVSPAISFWGSYQRMQGFYTTLSYVVIFFAIVVNLRTRAQVDRLINVIIITSLPIALYGILQRYGLDPVPWEGNVTVRIASTMGNSIFVAAYIIMAFPLTLGRIIEHFREILEESRPLFVQMISASLYVFIAILQVVTLYLSQSRGPVLGWLASSVFLIAMLLILYRKKWLINGFLILIILVGAFFILFNIESGPLEKLRTSPAIGRFGRLLDPESNSALVRRYIWEGTAKLVAPHEPLTFPDGSVDTLNAIRALVGYGPESMFVVFNPFYVPELGRVEKRNASPDRSHNETWDALVTGGGLGLIVYLGLFGSIFYYGFKWLGFVSNHREKIIFWVLTISGGIAGGLIATLWRGLPYIGIGLPFGFVFGLFLYLLVRVIIYGNSFKPDDIGVARYILLAVLLTAILAHFIEINFGIAVVATRTYFWVYSGLLFVVGYVFTRNYEFEEEDYFAGSNQTQSNRIPGDTPRGKNNRNHGYRMPNLREALVPSLLLALIIATLGYDLIGNSNGLDDAFSILWNSMTKLGEGDSSGILILVLTTWVVSGVLLAGRQFQDSVSGDIILRDIVKTTFFVLGISITVGGFFWLWHATGLALIARDSIKDLQELMAQVTQYEQIFTRYIIYLLAVVVVTGYLIATLRDTISRKEQFSSIRGILASLVIFPLALWLANVSNFHMVQGDIAFRLAGSFARPGQWPAAIQIYQRANTLVPGEDYYYLSLAGAYFEHAKSIDNPVEREELFLRVEQDLLRAQNLSPLDTDHTANLARLYNLWAAFTSEPVQRLERLEKSSEYYEIAVTLSPNNPRLWSEWALLYLNSFKNDEVALELLSHAIEIDDDYDWAHGLLADYYTRSANETEDEEEKLRLLELAVQEYEKAIERVKYYEAQYLPGYVLASASIYSKLGDYDKSIEYYELALEKGYTTETWRVEEALARLYYQIGSYKQAIQYVNDAILHAPQEQADRLSNLLNQIESSYDQ